MLSLGIYIRIHEEAEEKSRENCPPAHQNLTSTSSFWLRRRFISLSSLLFDRFIYRAQDGRAAAAAARQTFRDELGDH